MHSCDDETMVNRIGATDLVVTSDRPILVDAVRAGGESRTRIVKCDCGPVRPSQESMVRLSVGSVLSDDEATLVDVIHEGLCAR